MPAAAGSSAYSARHDSRVGARANIKMRIVLLVLLVLQVALLGVGSLVHSPTADEPAHLASGWSHWKLGRFDLYRVNPPLVRMIASLPLTLSETEIRLDSYSVPGARGEFVVGRDLQRDLGAQTLWMMTRARWMCLPFSILGALVCYRWSSELYGQPAGLLAATLWCFSPGILAHGQLITPDVAAASLGAAATYWYWRWLKKPGWKAAVSAGVVLGIAQLTKFTLIVLIPLWPLLWLACRTWKRGDVQRESLQLSVLLLCGLYVVNAGYTFEGSCRRLKEYRFASRALNGSDLVERGATSNRFRQSWWGELPVPLPANYVLGMDVQRRAFEEGHSSYLNGQWRPRGWWYYYLYALVLKEPLGIWGLAAVAAFWSVPGSATRCDEAVLLTPLLAILLLVSSQTGFSHHARYVLPICPFAIIWISRVAARRQGDAEAQGRRGAHRQYVRRATVLALLCWTVASSLSVYPHSLSYFNELAGGPLGGPKRLLASNTDWGQNLIYLRRWVDDHPEVRNMRLAWAVDLVDPAIVGLDIPKPPSRGALADVDKPLWCLVSVNELYAQHGKYDYLRERDPTDVIAYSIYVYRID